MGWTGTYDQRPLSVIVTEEIEAGGRHKVVGRSGRYYAVANVETGTIDGLVIKSQRNRFDGYLLYKYIDETEGPYETGAPASILDLLTPTDSDYANEWRSACRANIAAAKAQPKLAPGDRIELDSPVKFTSGMKASTFYYEGRYSFRANHEDGPRVRLPKNWKRRYKWTKVDPAPPPERNDDGTVKGVRIGFDKTVTAVELAGLDDYQAAVDGLIEAVRLKDGSTMYVNEEYRYRFTADEVNWTASDIAAAMGLPNFLFDPILGPVVIVGPVNSEGYDTDVTERALRAIRKVAREAGAAVTL